MSDKTLTPVSLAEYQRVCAENERLKQALAATKEAPAPSYCFTATAKRLDTKFKGLEKVGVWTDGLSISSESEHGWRPAYEFEAGKTYTITISER